MNQKTIEQIFTKLLQNTPNPDVELVYGSNFELLIAVLLSAQTTDIAVNKATIKLFKAANTPEQMLNLGLDNIKQCIKTIGLYNTKASNILKTCQILVDKFDSQIPSAREDLESLPGVGRKTASVILNTAFATPAIAVDTHVLRLANRIGLAKGKTPLEIEKQLLKIIPKKFISQTSNLLILHGRYICVAKKPKCDECIISSLCMDKIKYI